MVEFNLELLKGKKVAVNCKTKEQSDSFLEWTEKTLNDSVYNNHWKQYEEETCYEICEEDEVFYSNIEGFEDEGYTIVSYEEAILYNSKEDI